MPGILLELIDIVAAVSEADSALEGFTAVAETFMGSKYKLLEKAIKNLTGAQEIHMRKAIGEEFTNRIKKHFNVDIDSKKPIKTFWVQNHSEWVETLAWSPVLGTLTLTVQNNSKTYKLPFFPRSAVTAIQNGSSPGKTIWRRYWRIVGKGKFSNKTKNKIRVEATKKVTKVINVAVPTLKVPKMGSKKAFNKNLIKKATVKTGNTPKTGAKGVTIKIKTPKIRKY